MYSFAYRLQCSPNWIEIAMWQIKREGRQGKRGREERNWKEEENSSK